MLFKRGWHALLPSGKNLITKLCQDDVTSSWGIIDFAIDRNRVTTGSCNGDIWLGVTQLAIVAAGRTLRLSAVDTGPVYVC